jgi:uncharacterized protein with von Willebrand factor type A (vWA) domain
VKKGMVPVLVGFGRALRSRGLAVGPGDVATYCAAAATLDPTDLADLYWTGRTTLVSRRDDLAAFDEAFHQYFLGGKRPVDELLRLTARVSVEAESTLEVPLADEPGEEDDEQATMGLVASAADVLRHRAFADCTPDELRAVRRITAKLRLDPPRRRTRRSRPSARGRRPDLRRTVREALRLHGEPVPLRWREPRVRPRPLVLILDVSGSMADHSRALLQFAWSARRAVVKVEVFCFGTRLTRITPALRRRSPDRALADAAELVFDWDGGTRIGASLDRFVRTAGRRGVARGGVVVICSDGMDRGDPDLLASAMERLSRQCRRIVWCTPHGPGSSVGLVVAEPHIDRVVKGRDLASLAELADLLPALP